MKKLILLGLLMYAVMSAPALATITILEQYPHPDSHYPTYQAWTFSTQPSDWTKIEADVDQNPYGTTPTADVTLVGPIRPLPGWYAQLDASGHTGLIFGSAATIVLDIPNIIEERYPYAYEKIVQVEVTYHVQAYQEGVTGYIDGQSYVTAGGTTYDSVSVNDKDLGGGWRDVTITFSSFPQIYDSETIRLYFVDSGAAIDSIEVATVCIPEPATLLLLGGAGLVGLLRRRRTI